MIDKFSNRPLLAYLTYYKSRRPETYSNIVDLWSSYMGGFKVKRLYPKFHAKVHTFLGNNRKLVRETVLTLKHNDCPMCGKPMSKLTSNGCSTRCSTLNPVVKAKSQETYLERTGYRFSSSNPDVQAKRKANYKEKTGYSHWSSNPEIQEKKEQTNLKNRGVRFPMQDVSVWSQGVATRAERIKSNGGIQPMSRPEVLAARKKTYVKRFGCSHPMKNNEVAQQQKDSVARRDIVEPGWRDELEERKRQNSLKKWGYSHPMKNPEHFESRLTRAKRWKSKVLRKEFMVQGDEPVVFDALEREGARVVPGRKGLPYITYKDADGKERTYYVDGKVTSAQGNRYAIEVKCPYTLTHWLDSNLSKFQSAKKQLEKYGIGFILAVHVGDGDIDFLKNPTPKQILSYIKESDF